MCGVNHESLVTDIVIAVVKNEKFFENMTTEEKVKSVAQLYDSLRHEIVEHEYWHEHDHEHTHEHEHDHDNVHR